MGGPHSLALVERKRWLAAIGNLLDCMGAKGSAVLCGSPAAVIGRREDLKLRLVLGTQPRSVRFVRLEQLRWKIPISLVGCWKPELQIAKSRGFQRRAIYHIERLVQDVHP